VAEKYRGKGIAKELKRRGEVWARSIGASFMNTHVLVDNERMLAINASLGYQPYKVKMRKKL
jgi:GNAT superfamily N-acetyltransferase